MPEIKTRRQSKAGFCGIAMIRSVLATQFKIRVSELQILKLFKEYCKLKGKNVKDHKNLILNEGVNPEFIAFCFKKYTSDVKILCYRMGDIYKLDYLLKGFNIVPIIHQLICYPEFGDNKPDGHYLMFGGFISNFKVKIVKIFDPSRYGGLKYLDAKEFERKWYSNNEKWFLVVVPNEIKLESRIFKGKYI